MINSSFENRLEGNENHEQRCSDIIRSMNIRDVGYIVSERIDSTGNIIDNTDL